MFGTDEKTKLQGELARLGAELEVAAQARGKITADRAQLEHDLMGVPPGDDAGLERLLARQRALAEKDDLLKRRGELTTAAIAKTTKGIEAAEARARADRIAALRKDLAKADAAAREAAEAAEATLRARLVRVHEVAGELHELERERPFSFWAAASPDHPLRDAAVALEREDAHLALRAAS